MVFDAEKEYSEEVILGCVLVAGAVAAEEAGAAALCAGGGPARLVRLLRLRQEDDDLVLQLVFAFRQLLRHRSSAAYLINNTGESILPVCVIFFVTLTRLKQNTKNTITFFIQQTFSLSIICSEKGVIWHPIWVANPIRLTANCVFYLHINHRLFA